MLVNTHATAGLGTQRPHSGRAYCDNYSYAVEGCPCRGISGVTRQRQSDHASDQVAILNS
jgi:hypothetical protein